MKDNNMQKPKRWLGEMIVAVCAAACLLLFYFPKQPKYLTSYIGSLKDDHCIVKKDIFPASGLLVGMSYRCLQLYGLRTTFYTDFAVPESEGTIRVWVTPDDSEKIMADPEIEVRAYTVDVLDTYTNRWVRYVARHPHGNGLFLMVGIVMTVFFFILVVKHVCFNPAKKQFP
ncbi:MAG: hypothetical protein J5641_02955 [Bacteroidales bacterium]|nr:hypothetical protein [Bacteroidales bacterium]